MSLAQYEAYKPSGVESLGRVPRGWRVGKLKRLFNVVGGSTPRSEEPSYWDGDLPWVTPADLSKLDSLYIRMTRRSITKDGLESCGTNVVPAGSIIVSTRAPIGSVAIAATEMTTNQGCRSLIPRESVVPEYFAYLLLANTRLLNALGNGPTFLEISGGDLGEFEIPIPPYEDQRAASRFLDHETARIDALIAEQERLIELLQEKRQAEISHAVSGGLGESSEHLLPNVAGFDEAPLGWRLVPLRYCCDLVRDGTHLPPPRVDTGVPLLSVRNVQDGVFALRDDDSMISHADYDVLCRAFIPQPGDVLLAIVGATLGKCAVIPEGMGDFHVQRSLAVFRPGLALRAEWLRLVFESRQFQTLLWQSVGFSAQPGIYLGELSSVRIPIPSVDEQGSILQAIDRELGAIQRLAEACKSGLQLLQERRSALISAAVTGQIDVRSLVPEAAA